MLRIGKSAKERREIAAMAEAVRRDDGPITHWPPCHARWHEKATPISPNRNNRPPQPSAAQPNEGGNNTRSVWSLFAPRRMVKGLYLFLGQNITVPLGLNVRAWSD